MSLPHLQCIIGTVHARNSFVQAKRFPVPRTLITNRGCGVVLPMIQRCPRAKGMRGRTLACSRGKHQERVEQTKGHRCGVSWLLALATNADAPTLRRTSQTVLPKTKPRRRTATSRASFPRVRQPRLSIGNCPSRLGYKHGTEPKGQTIVPLKAEVPITRDGSPDEDKMANALTGTP